MSKLTYFILASLALHGAVMVVKFRSPGPTLTHKKQQSDAIKVTFLPEGTPKTASLTKKQIVQSEDSKSLLKPKDQSFLSDKNRQFDRESMAKNVDIFKN